MTSFPGPDFRELFSSVHQRLVSQDLVLTTKEGIGKYLVSKGKLPCPFLLALCCLTIYLAWRDDDDESPLESHEMRRIPPNPQVEQAVSRVLPSSRAISSNQPILPDLGASRNRGEEIALQLSDFNGGMILQSKVGEKESNYNAKKQPDLKASKATSSRLLSAAPPGGPALLDFAQPVPLTSHQMDLKSLLDKIDSLQKEMKKRTTPHQIGNWKQHLTEIQKKMSALECSSLPASKKSLKLTQDPAHLKSLSLKLDSLNRQMKTKATSIQVLAWKQFLTEIHEEIRKSSN